MSELKYVRNCEWSYVVVFCCSLIVAKKIWLNSQKSRKIMVAHTHARKWLADLYIDM